MVKFDEVLAKGFNALYFVSSLSSHFRDLIVSKSGGVDSLLELPNSLKARYREQSARCSMQFLYDALSITTACESGYKASVNPRLHIEFALMKLSFLNGVAGVSVQPVSARPAPSAAPVPASSASPAPAPRPAPVEAPKPAPVVEQAPAPKPQPVAQPVAPAEPAPVKPAEPAPVSAPVEAESPAPSSEPVKRRRPVAAASLSLSSIKEQKVAAQGASPLASMEGGSLPSDDSILEVWKSLPASFAAQPRLANTLSMSKTTIREEEGMKVLSFQVMNVAQQQWIKEKLLHTLEGKVQAALKTVKVRLEVDVVPDTEVKKTIYMPEEKAKDLISKNDEVRKLVEDFNLDTK